MLAVNLFHTRGGRVLDRRDFFWEDLPKQNEDAPFNPGEFFSALLKQIYLDQTVYDETGLRQYTDSTYAEYLRNRKTGDVTNMDIVEGYCQGSAADDAIAGFLAMRTTEIHGCFYKTTFNGPGHVGFVSGGFYRQKVLTYTRDERTLTEAFDAWRDGFYTWSCEPGPLPQRWYKECDFSRR